MGNLIILNGSPRAPRSHSRRYAEAFSACYPGQTDCFDLIRTDRQALCAQIGDASGVLFVFPLYADALPVPLLNFLKFLEDHPPRQKPPVSVLINCGFLEPRQNEIAVQMMRLFCRRNQYPFGSVLMMGSGEAIWDSPFRFLATRKIRRFAGSVARGTQETFQVTMPLTKRIFVRAAASYWEQYGKKHGVSKQQMQTMQIEQGPIPDPPASQSSPPADKARPE